MSTTRKHPRGSKRPVRCSDFTPDITATEASRSFSRILDTVEHDDTTYVIVRHGSPVAQLTPVVRCTGQRLKELLHDHPRDAEWREDLATVRDLLEDKPRWT